MHSTKIDKEYIDDEFRVISRAYTAADVNRPIPKTSCVNASKDDILTIEFIIKGLTRNKCNRMQINYMYKLNETNYTLPQFL